MQTAPAWGCCRAFLSPSVCPPWLYLPPVNPAQGIPDHFRAAIPKTDLGNPWRRHSPNFQSLAPKAWILCSALPSRCIFIQRFY